MRSARSTRRSARRIAARRLREPDLDEAIRAWEARLAPLAEAAAADRAAARPSARDRGAHSRRGARGAAANARRRRAEAESHSLARGGDRRVGHRRRFWRSGSSVARDDARGAPASIRRDPAEGRRIAGLRGHRQSRQPRVDGAPGRGDSAAGQGIRILDHRPQARRAALARRHRRRWRDPKRQSRAI